MLQFLIKQDIDLMNIMRSAVDLNSNLQVESIKFLADFWVILVPVLLVLFWLYWVYKNEKQFKIDSLLIFYSIAISFFIYFILNLWLPFRPRPESFSTIRPLIDHIPNNSFPSGHAIFSGASIFAFLYYSKKWFFWLVLIFCLVMIICRILAWIHYPSDIFAGFILGLIWGYITYKYKNSKLFTAYLIPLPIKLASFLKL